MIYQTKFKLPHFVYKLNYLPNIYKINSIYYISILSDTASNFL